MYSFPTLKVNEFYARICHRYGLFLCKHYVLVILAALTVNVALSCGLYALEFLPNSDEEFMVSNSEAMHNEAYLSKLFSQTNPMDNFFLHQVFNLGLYAELNFHVLYDEKQNVLKEEYLNEIRDIHMSIVETVSIAYGNRSYKFNDLCAKQIKMPVKNNSCVVDGVDLLDSDFFEFLNETLVKLRADAEYKPPFLYISRKGKGAYLNFNLGKDFRYLTGDNETDLAYSNVLKIRYALNSNQEHLAKEWELEFLKFIQTIKSNQTSFTYAVSQSLLIEIKNSVEKDVFKVFLFFMLVVVSMVILASSNTNRVTSPGILPCFGIMLCMFSITSSIGLLAYAGLKACSLVFFTPFVVIGKLMLKKHFHCKNRRDFRRISSGRVF
jgi:hypothetical protein